MVELESWMVQEIVKSQKASERLGYKYGAALKPKWISILRK